MKCDSGDDNNKEIVNYLLPEHEYALKSVDLGSVLKNELDEFTETALWYRGHMEGGMERCNSFLKRLQYLGYHFSVRSSISKQIGTKDNPRLSFSNSRSKMCIEMFGPVFYVTRYYHMVCLRGPRRCPSGKREDTQNQKVKVAKKIGCPAQLNIKIIKYFPKYAVSENAKLKTKHKIMSQLKDDISNPNCVVQFCERVYISISKESIHKHAPLLKLHETKKKCKRRVIRGRRIQQNESISVNNCENDHSDHIEDDDLTKDETLLQKQNELRSLATDVAIVSNLISDEGLLDRSIREFKELLEQMKRPFYNGSIIEIKGES